jgi:two-component system, cell cycle response regulator CpdR
MAQILVAEDDQFTREMVQRALQADGHEVKITGDGSEALAAFEGGAAYDLVITDVEMPNVDGLALVENILAKQADQKILIMSGLADELTKARALLGPTVRMITKPVTLEKIRGEANELLG